MFNSLGAVGVKQESTVGTAETITASEVIMCSEPSLNQEADMRERNQVRDVAATLAPLKGGVKAPFSGKFEVKNEGTAGTEYSTLNDILEACGFNGTTVAGYKVSYVLDEDLSSLNSMTVKRFLDGKYRTSKGVRGNLKLEMEPGGICYFNVEGQGAFEADGDVSVLAEPADTYKPPVLLDASMRLLEIEQDTLHEDADGDAEKLRSGADTKMELAIKITGTGKAVKMVGYRAKKVGTPANETNGLSVEIQGDNAGAPDGTAITDGGPVNKATSDIADSYEWIYFTFPTAPTLTDSTDYWIVVSGDYDVDADNCIEFDTDVVTAGNQICQVYDASWSALSLENLTCRVLIADADTADDSDLLFGTTTIDVGAEVALRVDPNDDNGYHSGRISMFKPTLEIEPLEKLNSERDFWSYLDNSTDLFFCCTIGSTSGNKLQVYMPHLKRADGTAEWGDREGETTHPMTLQHEEPGDLVLELR